MKKNIILGIDPGSNLLGYAFLDVQKRQKPRAISMGVLDMRKFESQSQKLHFIYKELQELIQLYQPGQAAVEAPFFGKDAQAMLKLGRAQGVAMAAIAAHGIEAVEYSPRSIKKAVTGNGNAQKEQVAKMLPLLISGEIDFRFLDASDALGVAYCHHLLAGRGLPTKSGAKKSKNAWSSFLQSNPNRKLKL